MRAWFWLILLAIIGFALRKKMRSVVIHPTQSAAQTEVPAQRVAETMVCCALCQTYVPVSESVQRNQHDYCCQAHADQAHPH